MVRICTLVLALAVFATTATGQEKLDLDRLVAAHRENENAAKQKYVGKTFTLEGTVFAVINDEEGATFVLKTIQEKKYSVSCNFNVGADSNRAAKVMKGDKVVFTGRLKKMVTGDDAEKSVHVIFDPCKVVSHSSR